MWKGIIGIIFSISPCLAGIFNTENNACKTYSAYFYRFVSPDCYHNDEYFLNTHQLLDYRKIPYENHTVTTEDGYILRLFRVVQDKPKGIMVLLHPMFQDSRIWFAGLNESYVSNFFKAGYEIWLPQFRGVEDSRNHVKNLTDIEYWDFSMTELGIYDCPAILSYVFHIAQQKLIVISHSMGGTVSAISASLRPEVARKFVMIFIAMGMSSFMANMGSMEMKLWPLFIPLIQKIQKRIPFGAVLTRYQGLLLLLKKFMMTFPTLALSLHTKPHPFETPIIANPEYVPMMISFSGQPVSMKLLYQYGQFIGSGRFAQYDYGNIGNLKHYNSTKPPMYPIKNIHVPFYIIYGTMDIIADKKGNELFYSKLSTEAKVYGKLEIKHYEHADFLWAEDFVEEVQMKILHLLDKI